MGIVKLLLGQINVNLDTSEAVFGQSPSRGLPGIGVWGSSEIAARVERCRPQ